MYYENDASIKSIRRRLIILKQCTTPWKLMIKRPVLPLTPSTQKYSTIATSKGYKVVRQFFTRRSVREFAVSLVHSQDTSTSITRFYTSQLFTAFSFRLSNTNPQKCDSLKSHSRREYKVVHSFWVVKVWQSGVRKKWKRYSTPQFFKLVIFSVYPSSIGINWKSIKNIFSVD